MNWFRRLFQRNAKPPARSEGVANSWPVPTAPIPEFIKPVASDPATPHNTPHEHFTLTPHHRENRDPGRALGRLRSRAFGTSHCGSASARTTANEAESIDSGLALFAEINAAVFTTGTAHLEHRNGAEHNALFDPVTSRVVKLTQPGEYGAWGGLEEYVQRLAWSNELFDDHWLIEGWLRYPNETAPRLVTSQPWYRVNPENPEPTLEQIDAYMWQLGWLKAYEGAWIHLVRKIVVSDALSKNFVLDVAGYVMPIDLIILKPDQEQWQRLQAMASSLPQG